MQHTLRTVSRSTLILIQVYIHNLLHRRIADEYCGGAAVTKFPTKYLRIELCAESLLCE